MAFGDRYEKLAQAAREAIAGGGLDTESPEA